MGRRRPKLIKSSNVSLDASATSFALPIGKLEFDEPSPPPTPFDDDLAARNAPTKTLELIGDPRTGVADDTTIPLGSGVTVQPIYMNETSNVTWYRYTNNGENLHQCHRDGRLSDYSKNLMYILRAKDPATWTITALAAKFRIRRQRVLAILAIKEMEAQQMERQETFAGPLSTFAFPVNLSDVVLDPETGEPIDYDDAQMVSERKLSGGSGRRRSKGAAGALGSLEEFTAGSSPSKQQQQQQHLSMQEMLPSVQYSAQALQLQLLQLLQPHNYSFVTFKRRTLEQLNKAEQFYQEHFGAAAAAAAEGEQQQAAPLVDFPKYKKAVEGLLVVLEPFLGGAAGLKRQHVLHTTASGLRNHLQRALGHKPSSSSSSSSEEEQPAEPQVAEAAAAAAEAADPVSKLQRFVSSSASAEDLPIVVQQLSAAEQQQLYELVPGLRERVASSSSSQQQQGDASSSSPSSSSSSSSSSSVPLLDLWHFRCYPDEQVAGLIKAMQNVDTARARVQQLLVSELPLQQQQQQEEEVVSGKVGALRRLRHQLGQYSLLDSLWDQVQQQGEQEQEGAAPVALSLEEKSRMVQVLCEAAPRNAELLGFYELYHKHAGVNPRQAARQLAQIHAVAGAEAPNNQRLRRMRYELGAWAATLSDEEKVAFIDRHVIGRIYHRGSGEQHQVDLPSFPHFEGYTLQEVDDIEEGELSAVKRLAALREDDAMWRDFREKILFNLGLIGEDLWLMDGHVRPQRPEQGWSLVVHSQGEKARRVPTFVSLPDGSHRGLTESEAYLEQLRMRKRNTRWVPRM